jgi:hypothetical protein
METIVAALAGACTYREHHNDVFFAFDDDGQVEANFEALERFVDENILDRSRRNESCRCCG